jgi:hypothetical protein
MDYYPSIFTKNNSNYDDLGLQIIYQSPYEYANDQDPGLNHTRDFKMGLDGKPYSYGNAPDTIGTFKEGLRDWTMTKPAAKGPTSDPPTPPKGMGLWKVAADPTKLGRRQALILTLNYAVLPCSDSGLTTGPVCFAHYRFMGRSSPSKRLRCLKTSTR